jgi:hypothetical protein
MAMTISEKIRAAERAGTEDVRRGERVERTPGPEGS